MRKICIINQKGGVGKTTTTVNLGAGLSRKNRRVLLIDLDPQGSVGTCFNDSSQKDMYEFLLENADIRECIRPLGINFDMISSKETLLAAEVQIHRMENKETLLRRKLNDYKDVVSKYDYLLIDCPPSLGILTLNAVMASSEAIIPTTCDYLGYHNTKMVYDFIENMAERYDHEIDVSKIIPTLYDPKCNESNIILTEIKNDFYEIVADPIRHSSKVKESPRFGQSIFKYAADSKGAEDYFRLVNQVMYDERKYKLTPRADLKEDIDSEGLVEERVKSRTKTSKVTAKMRKVKAGKKGKDKVGAIIKKSKKAAKSAKAKKKSSKAFPFKDGVSKDTRQKKTKKKMRSKRIMKKYKVQSPRNSKGFFAEFAG